MSLQHFWAATLFCAAPLCFLNRNVCAAFWCTCKSHPPIFSKVRSIVIVYTGWRRPIQCLISKVSVRKLATNHRALLRKITCKVKASYGSWPPCSKIEEWAIFLSFLFCRRKAQSGARAAVWCASTRRLSSCGGRGCGCGGEGGYIIVQKIRVEGLY